MDYAVRKITEKDYDLLEDFLYEAIFIPEGTAKHHFLFKKQTTQ